MNLSAIKTRLAANAGITALGAYIGIAADLEAAWNGEAVPQLPALYVVPQSENAGASSSSTFYVDQTRTVSFAVIMAVENVRDATGGEAMIDLDAVRLAVEAALIAYTPPDCESPIVYSSGSLAAMRDGVLWWQDVFLTKQQITRVPT